MTRDVVLNRGPVTLRPLRRSDESNWLTLRKDNHGWLRAWEANSPPGHPPVTSTFPAYVRLGRKRWKARAAYGAGIFYDGELVGRVAIETIVWGAHCGGSIGYWIAQSHAGRSIVPTAVAMLSEYAFATGIHRLEIAVRPENQASLRVAHKLGARSEGLRRNYLYIDGDWRDHEIFVLASDEARVGPFWTPSS
jgi:ribosomal-protein-alanine N-acetyltransferase